MTRIGFIGFGKMAEALWSSFRHQADVDGASTYEVNPIRIAVATDLGMTISQSINDVISSSNITFLCVKPQILSTLGQYDAGDSIVISILAGKSIATVGKTIQSRKLVRVMPNTPCMVNQGMAAVAWSDGVNDTEKSLVRALLGANGRVEDVPEEWMDVVTGISGSGPAFLYRLAESAIAAAADCGMPPDVAIRLLAQTMIGAGTMLLEAGKSPYELVADVSSPGGTTLAGLDVFDRGNIAARFTDVIRAAADRSRELSHSSSAN